MIEYMIKMIKEIPWFLLVPYFLVGIFAIHLTIKLIFISIFSAYFDVKKQKESQQKRDKEEKHGINSK